MFRVRTLILIAPLAVAALVQLSATPQAAPSSGIYHGTWIDLNKNRRIDPYEDPSQPVDRRLDDLNANNTLPLRKDIKSILVTGPNAAEVENSVSRYGPSSLDVVSVVEGTRTKLGPAVVVHYTKGAEFADAAFPESEIIPVPPNASEQAELDKARDLATQIDAAVVVLGENEALVGESRSRTSLDLTGFQLKLVQAVQAAGKPTVVVLLNGRPLSINWIDKFVPAVVEAWFQGEFCGTAIADVLFGDYNPSGKLPVTFPKSVGQIPFNFPFKRGSQVPTDQLSVCAGRSRSSDLGARRRRGQRVVRARRPIGIDTLTLGERTAVTKWSAMATTVASSARTATHDASVLCTPDPTVGKSGAKNSVRFRR